MSIGERIKGRLNGRFDRAYAIARKNQFEGNDRAELCDVGGMILGSVSDLTDDEQRAVERFRAGGITPSADLSLAALLDRGAFTPQQRRVIDVANRLAFRIPEPRPEPPEDLELLREIGEAGAVVEAYRGLHAQAQERLMLAEIERRKTHRDPKATARWDAADARCLRVEEELRAAHAAWERAQSALADLQQSRERMRRAWFIEQSTKKAVPQ